MTEIIEIDSGNTIQVVVSETTSEAVVVNENANLSLFVPQSHANLTNLGADDHTQYHNDTRGDIRYYVKAAVDALLANKQDVGNYITALTGEASAVGGGSVPITLSNAAVIGKVLTGFSSAAGALSATDSLLAAIQKLDGNVGLKANSAVTISTTAPLAGGGDLSANRTLTIADAAADGTTKGAATFAAADFNATSGLISIDYTNGQAATAGQKGFLTSADWSIFNAKAPTASPVFTGNVQLSTAGSYLLIGATALPSYDTQSNLYITDTAGLEPKLTLDAFATSANITCWRANTSAASPSALSSADVLLFFGVRGYHSGGAYSGNIGALRFLAAEAFTSGANGNYFEIATTAIGATARAQRAKFDENGILSSNHMDIATAGSFKINALAVLFQSGTSYTILQAYNGTGSIQLGNGSDPNTYYNNTTHTFRNLATSTTWMTISTNGIIASTIFKPVQATTAGAPAYVKGAMYFDTTLNKLRIGGATAWETVTSV